MREGSTRPTLYLREIESLLEDDLTVQMFMAQNFKVRQVSSLEALKWLGMLRPTTSQIKSLIKASGCFHVHDEHCLQVQC